MSKPIGINTSADVLAFVPHSLGYTPSESFVFITLRGNVSGATLRVDAPTDKGHATAWAKTVTRHLVSDSEADGVMLAVYTDRTEDADHTIQLVCADAAKDALAEAGLPVRDSWIVTSAGWGTFPGAGELRPLAEIGDSKLSAELVFQGSNPAANATVADPDYNGKLTCEDITGAGHAYRVANVMDMQAAPMRAARSLWRKAIVDGVDTTPAAALVATLKQNATRDRILADFIDTSDEHYIPTLMGETITRPDWKLVDAAEAVLNRLLEATPSAERAPLYTALGWIQWNKGRGTIAAAHLAKALEAEANYALAIMLDDVLNQGMLPKIALNQRTAYSG